MTLGRFLREKRAGKLQRDVVAACELIGGALGGFHCSALSGWERDQRCPSAAQLEVLATALGLSPAEKLYALQLARQDAADRAAERAGDNEAA